MSRSPNLRLQLREVPFLFFTKAYRLPDITNLVFNGRDLGMVLRFGNNGETRQTGAPRDCLMNVRLVMENEIIPYENVVVISDWNGNGMRLDGLTNLITKIPKDVGGGPDLPHALDPPPRVFNASA